MKAAMDMSDEELLIEWMEIEYGFTQGLFSDEQHQEYWDRLLEIDQEQRQRFPDE